jgi:RNA polymerase sigma-70 factor (ECF subfamily)
MLEDRLSSMNEQNDKELVKATLRGEKKAFEMLIRKYQQPLLNYIGRMVGERELAVDFTQDVFIRAYASLRSFEPRYKFSTWLYKIASNLVIDYWRKKKIPTFSLSEPVNPDRDGLSMDIPDEGPSVVRKFEMAELRRRIEGVLEQIPASLRELFVWRHVNGLSYEEMAEITDLPVGTVKNRVYQAKEMVRQRLEAGP